KLKRRVRSNRYPTTAGCRSSKAQIPYANRCPPSISVGSLSKDQRARSRFGESASAKYRARGQFIRRKRYFHRGIVWIYHHHSGQAGVGAPDELQCAAIDK